MTRGVKGFTLLEIVVASALLFLVAVYVMQLFGTGIAHSGKSRFFTIGTFLAQSKMEQTLYQTSLSPGTTQGAFGDPFAAYAWAITVKPTQFDPKFYQVAVDVSGPEQEKSHLVSLVKSNYQFYGISVDQHSGKKMYVSDNKTDVNKGVWEYQCTTPLQCTSQGQKTSFLSTGIAADSFNDKAWVGNAGNNPNIISGIGFSDLNPASAPFNGKIVTMATPAGIACDRGNTDSGKIFVTDSANLLWECPAAFNQNGTQQNCNWQVISGGFSQAAGVVMDDNGSIVWIADRGANNLRYFNGALDPNGYAPGAGLVSPTGVAIPGNSGDQVVYVVDSKNIWEYNFKSNVGCGDPCWSIVAPLPAGLDSPVGLAVTPGVNPTFYVLNTSDWTVRVYDSNNGAWNTAINLP